MSEKHIGEVVQVTGPVLDIRFPEGELPALLKTTTARSWLWKWRSRQATTWFAALP